MLFSHDKDVDPVQEMAVFGKQVEDFLDTRLGKYLVKKAEAEATLAADKLKRVAPWRRRKIQELQNQIITAERFQQWLAFAIMDGAQAMQILEDKD
jgi:hypothetical protein